MWNDYSRCPLLLFAEGSVYLLVGGCYSRVTEKTHFRTIYTGLWIIPQTNSLGAHSRRPILIFLGFCFVFCIDKRIYLNLSKSTQSAAGLKASKPAAKGRYLRWKSLPYTSISVALILAFMHLYSIFNLQLVFFPIIFYIFYFVTWYWNARPTQSMVPASPNFICHFLREQYRRDYLSDYVNMFYVCIIMCLFCIVFNLCRIGFEIDWAISLQ